MLPILHLNGAKIAGPTVLGRKDPAEVRSLLEGHGYEVIEVEGDDLPGMHHRFADGAGRGLRPASGAIQAAARDGDWDGSRPRWPMIVLRTPKGWTGPDEVDGVQVDRHLALAPGAAVRRQGQPRAPARCWRSGCGRTGPRSCSTTTARPIELVPAGQSRRATCG